jgi:ribokinase
MTAPVTGGVVVVGSLSMDLSVKTAVLPAPGETVMGESFTMVPGGKGNNQAVACARQEVATAIIGRVGADAFGDAVRARLVAEGVDVSQLTTDEALPTGVAHITLDASGQNSIIVVPEANRSLTAAHVLAASGLIERAAVLLVQLEVPLEAVRAALHSARGAGTITVLNPAPAPAALGADEELFSMADICVPNELEAATLTGRRVADLRGAVAAAGELIGRGCGSVVVTLGARGAVYADGERLLEIPPLTVPVVDTVAAGDAFCGALAAALAKGETVTTGLSRAAAAGALAVGALGATSSLPNRAAVDALLASNGGAALRRIER